MGFPDYAQMKVEAETHGWCSQMETTRCDEEPFDPVGDCDPSLRQDAEDLCSPVCDTKTTKHCIFDACAANDIGFAEEYEASCADALDPVTAPIAEPTLEPTLTPPPPSCGVAFSDRCQKNDVTCGFPNGALKRYSKKNTPTMLVIYMPQEEETTNPCTCEQMCMVKGAKYWHYEMLGEREYAPAHPRGKHGPIMFNECRCMAEDSGIKGILGHPDDKLVKRSVDRGEEFYAGMIVARDFSQA